MSSDIERITRLEARQENTEAAFASFAAESRSDRKALHETLDKVGDALNNWQSRQSGFIAGVSFVLALFAAGVAAGWKELIAFFKG